MLGVLFPVDAIPDRVPTLPPTFACWCADGGPEAACVHVAGELDMATAPRPESVQVLLQLAEQNLVR